VKGKEGGKMPTKPLTDPEGFREFYKETTDAAADQLRKDFVELDKLKSTDPFQEGLRKDIHDMISITMNDLNTADAHHLEQMEALEEKVKNAPAAEKETRQADLEKHIARTQMVALGKTMEALSEADRKRFVLTNVLEQLKTGKRLSNIIHDFNGIGLTDIAIAQQQPAPAAQTTVAEPPARFVRKLISRVASICRPLIVRAIAIVRAISERINIKIQPVIGTAGVAAIPWPTLAFSFDFDLQKNITGKEVFDVIESAMKGTVRE
jgi:hypothetical protein